ncbi:MAG: hypothetical protein ABIL09_27475 [Gemmatimonadota bacterium]
MGDDYVALPAEPAEELLERVLAFRAGVAGREPGQDMAALLAAFPRVTVREGYVLDYVQETTKDGVTLPIRPFVRPAADTSWAPMFDPEETPERDDLVEELYQYLQREPTPAGLFEYAFFAIELWAVRASSNVAEWPDSTPIFSAARFDAFLGQARKVSDLKRPEHFGPLVREDGDGGGQVRFLVHTPMGWERIYYLDSRVYGDGFIEPEAGAIVADMGSGLIF